MFLFKYNFPQAVEREVLTSGIIKVVDVCISVKRRYFEYDMKLCYFHYYFRSHTTTLDRLNHIE
jgi:hypothetical protein